VITALQVVASFAACWLGGLLVGEVLARLVDWHGQRRR
jgi:hypothetical protein